MQGLSGLLHGQCLHGDTRLCMLAYGPHYESFGSHLSKPAENLHMWPHGSFTSFHRSAMYSCACLSSFCSRTSTVASTHQVPPAEFGDHARAMQPGPAPDVRSRLVECQSSNFENLNIHPRGWIWLRWRCTARESKSPNGLKRSNRFSTLYNFALKRTGSVLLLLLHDVKGRMLINHFS